ncbi:MAG TPA: asparagine synthase-related protein [Bacteroidales bacterium]|nr:asparagine synthase-related protein [Bacteroidales bacterium]
MCGICGKYGESSPDKVKLMANAIRHRGPDGESFTNHPWGSLGFCWLDIFGPDKNPQPAFCVENNLSLVFNGEIYNFNELKSIIKSEEIVDEANLILKLYLIFGERTFEMLKGMFTIAIMSPGKLILARDKFGIKPLVYFVKNSSIYFASEIKALLQVYESNIEINKESLAETAVLGFVFNMEETMFKGIKQVLPGSYLVFEEGNVKTYKYSSIPESFYGEESWQKESSISHLSLLLNESAKMHADHAKSDQAIYLSGGVDSSLMTHFMQKHLNDKTFTYTLFDDPKSEDRLFAQKIANTYKTIHSEYETGIEGTLNFFKHYLYHYESIVTDGLFNVLGSLAFHILSSEIGKKHKISYCGEGADELFGGYYWLQAHPLGVGDRLRSRSKRVNKGKTSINEYIMHHFPDDDSKEKEIRKEIFDFLMGPGLTNCHLWSVDRSSSAFSFEARPFYLYNDIADWALSLPINDKVTKDNKTKLILKRFAASESNLLKEIADRKKIGMPAALNNSLIQLSEYSTKVINESGKKDLPHKEYSTFLFSDTEKVMFDIFYEIFIINKGRISLNI